MPRAYNARWTTRDLALKVRGMAHVTRVAIVPPTRALWLGGEKIAPARPTRLAVWIDNFPAPLTIHYWTLAEARRRVADPEPPGDNPWDSAYARSR